MLPDPDVGFRKGSIIVSAQSTVDDLYDDKQAPDKVGKKLTIAID